MDQIIANRLDRSKRIILNIVEHIIAQERSEHIRVVRSEQRRYIANQRDR